MSTQYTWMLPWAAILREVSEGPTALRGAQSEQDAGSITGKALSFDTAPQKGLMCFGPVLS